jgi:2-iminobutanoate/2-iminopropanoate deaminase
MPARAVPDPLVTTPPASPYTPALVAGPFVFLSGQTGRDPATGHAGETIEEQAEQALTNMRRMLGEAGAEMSQVVSVTIFLARREDMQPMNAVYRRFFSEPFPTRATVVVSLGRPDSLIEMQAVAYTGG